MFEFSFKSDWTLDRFDLHFEFCIQIRVFDIQFRNNPAESPSDSLGKDCEVLLEAQNYLLKFYRVPSHSGLESPILYGPFLRPFINLCSPLTPRYASDASLSHLSQVSSLPAPSLFWDSWVFSAKRKMESSSLLFSYLKSSPRMASPVASSSSFSFSFSLQVSRRSICHPSRNQLSLWRSRRKGFASLVSRAALDGGRSRRVYVLSQGQATSPSPSPRLHDFSTSLLPAGAILIFSFGTVIARCQLFFILLLCFSKLVAWIGAYIC